jgi:hypothetical protein
MICSYRPGLNYGSILANILAELLEIMMRKEGGGAVLLGV